MSLLWISKTKKHITFFCSLALLGIFFAKGVQPPFGSIYEWLFLHVPGFVMFRDSTKYYLFIAISYSILIPFVLDKFKIKEIGLKIKMLLFIVFILFWIFTIRAVFTGEVKGNFRPLTLTHEYIAFKDRLISDTISSRVLWIPRADPFVYSSNIHPVITWDQLIPDASTSEIVSTIQTIRFKEILRSNGIGYIVVPNDLEKRIYLENYTYAPTQRQVIIDALVLAGFHEQSAVSGLRVFTTKHDPMKIQYPTNISALERYAQIGTYGSILMVFVVLLSMIWV